MLMKFCCLRWIVPCAVVLCVSSVGAAGEPHSTSPLTGYVQTSEYDLQHTNWSDALTVDKFDGTLGELVSIELALEGSVEASAGYENLAAVPNDITLNAGALISGSFPDTQISTLGFELVINPKNLGTFWNVPVHDGTLDFGGESGQLLAGLAGSASDVLLVTAFHPVIQALLMSEFTDADGPEGGLDTLDMVVTASGASMATDAHGNVASFFQTTARGSYSLVYLYDTGSVRLAHPEPVSLAVALLGVLSLALGRPIRRKTIQ